MELQRVKLKKNLRASLRGTRMLRGILFNFRPIRSAMTPYAGLTPSLRMPTRTASSAKAYAPPYAGLTRAYARKVLGPALRGAYALAYAALRRSLRGEKLTILTILRRLTPYLTPPYAGAYAEFHFFTNAYMDN